MWQEFDNDSEGQEFFYAGQIVGPGIYQQVDRPSKLVKLCEPDVLPASCDGRVACYTRIINSWSQITASRVEQKVKVA